MMFFDYLCLLLCLDISIIDTYGMFCIFHCYFTSVKSAINDTFKEP